MDIVFVILHYMTIKETCKCVDYIKRNVDTEDYHIIIVDNSSTNGTGNELQSLYENELKITVILNKENLGFARGNNVGFRYAKDNFNPQYIVMLNNDVYLLENSLLEKLKKEYLRSSFYVLGPMILTGDGRCDVNPCYSPFETVADIDKKIGEFKRILRRYKYHYAPLFYKLSKILDFLMGKTTQIKKNYLERVENVKLHGCFMVFSERYVSEYDGLDESTFLYLEEEFLYKHMKTDKHTTVYDPSILVYHQEDVATDSVVLGKRKKKIFFCENNIKSLIALKKLYMQNDLNE